MAETQPQSTEQTPNPSLNYSDLSVEKKAHLKKTLKETEELLGLQAKIATHKATISQARLDLLKSNIEYFEITTPPKDKTDE